MKKNKVAIPNKIFPAAIDIKDTKANKYINFLLISPIYINISMIYSKTYFYKINKKLPF